MMYALKFVCCMAKFNVHLYDKQHPYEKYTCVSHVFPMWVFTCVFFVRALSCDPVRDLVCIGSVYVTCILINTSC